MASSARHVLAAVCASLPFVTAVACGDPTGGGTNINGTGAATGSGAAAGTGIKPPGTGGDLITPGSGGSSAAGNTGGAGGCLKIGMLGRLPTYGAVPGMDNTAALQAWLSSASNGTATADVFTTDTELTPEFLAQYRVLIVQALETVEGGPYWNISPAEVANFEAYVRAGGGVITLTGYGASAGEVNPTNALLAFTGMSYASDDILATCPDDDCCCTSNSVPLAGWEAAHPISAHLTAVGAFHGRSIVATGADIVASVAGKVYGATRQLDAGRVFTFCDEWVTYTSQWDGTGAETCATDPAHNLCAGRTADVYYQVPQFWYNAIRWASGDKDCFYIEDVVR